MFDQEFSHHLREDPDQSCPMTGEVFHNIEKEPNVVPDHLHLHPLFPFW